MHILAHFFCFFIVVMSNQSFNELDRSRATKSSDNSKLIEKPVEDVTIIWFDQNMDDPENADDVQLTKDLLREINDYVLLYSKAEPCFDYIKSVEKEKIFFITTGSYAAEHLHKTHDLKQIDSIFIFCFNRSTYLPLKEKYSKIIDIFTEQEQLMMSLRNNIELVTKQATVFGLFDGKQRSTRYLTKESASFLWFQLLTDILKNFSSQEQKHNGLDDMLAHCRSYYRGNQIESNKIEQFRLNYVTFVFFFSSSSYRLNLES